MCLSWSKAYFIFNRSVLWGQVLFGFQTKRLLNESKHRDEDELIQGLRDMLRRMMRKTLRSGVSSNVFYVGSFLIYNKNDLSLIKKSWINGTYGCNVMILHTHNIVGIDFRKLDDENLAKGQIRGRYRFEFKDIGDLWGDGQWVAGWSDRPEAYLWRGR